MSGEVGGLWNYKPHDSEEASVMKSTVINSSKEMTAYSDFPPSPELANYMHNRKLLQYFQDYAQHFKLHQYIRFNHKVINVKKSVDHSDSGRWLVEYEDSDEFDAVLLCTGHHKTPHWPAKWPGQDKFKGWIVHSHDYKEPIGYDDKRVVAVGIGNSGGDIAVELSRVAEQARRFTHKVMYMIPQWIRSWYVQKLLNDRFDHALYGIQPKHDVFSSHFTQNDELPMRIASGTVIVKPNIERVTEHDVHFNDGSIAKNIDYIVLSTGYEITFPIVDDKNLINVKDNQVDLYKYMFPLDQIHNTLAVIGLIQMQARVFFSVLAGETKLPTAAEMRNDMLLKREKMRKQYVASSRHTIQVDYIAFLDELATMIGCRPRFFPLLLKDPALAVACAFGPCAPYVYRINGPHQWEGTLFLISLNIFR
ncbi:unnamed protein product [Nippostrongylus brasiliensis]|uniref:Flavin-containing monooxygenase n=1 Tax=Nippostrongylus brasiliensis TaxID=27835 RepID=A0A0N4YA01_NIPBR|nr:unnamed protein product [Nippostrongylus brasiliensis]